MATPIEVAISTAIEAGELVLSASQRLEALNIEQKSPRDYVSEVDRDSERLIKERILQAFPDDGFLGEEFGQEDSALAGESTSWIVDPLDGTTNFIRGIPHYAISIARRKGAEVDVAVVYDPVKEELFSASLGNGAFLNGNAISVSKPEAFDGALIATGVPFSGKLLDELALFTGTLTDLLDQKTSGIRRLGSAALDLAYVAAGRYDGFWEARLQPWDIAAGALLVKEAGGQVNDFAAGNDYLISGDIVASSGAVLDVLAEACQINYGR